MATFVEIAKSFLMAVTSELDPYTEQKGIVVIDDKGQSVTLFTPSHIQFARYGRGPGKKPPLDPLIEWVTKEGIVSDPTEIRGTAFAIQRSIGENGTKNWVPNAPNALDEAISKHLQKYFGDLSQSILVEQSKEVNHILQERFPNTSQFSI